MPSDVSEEQGGVGKGIAQLEKAPEEDITISYDGSRPLGSDIGDSAFPGSKASENWGSVKPYVQALTWLDFESCLKLEEVTFPAEERCSREKLEYRFAKCGELFLGLFTSADFSKSNNPESSDDPATLRNVGLTTVATASTAVPVYSGTPDRKSILIGQVIATKTNNAGVRDGDMDFPPDWKEKHTKSAGPQPSTINAAGAGEDGGQQQPATPQQPGHHDGGRTLCIHSLAILPQYQGQGLGRLLLRSYIQRMEGSGVADRIAIIAHDKLVRFYESMGFVSRGVSPVKFAGGGWTDMILHLGSGD